MALNFPSNPTVGQVFQAEGASFVWTGTLWAVLNPATFPWATKDEAIAGVRGDAVMSPFTTKAAIDAKTAQITDQLLKARRKRLITPAVDPAAAGGEAVCFAWAIFVGSPVSIQSQRGVSGIARTGAGSYTFTFAETQPNNLYFMLGSCRGISNHPNGVVSMPNGRPFTTTQAFITTGNTGGSGSQGQLFDSSLVHVGFFRGS